MKKILFTVFFALAISCPAAAQVEFTPEVSIPGSEFQANQPVAIKQDTTSLCDYIIAYYKYGLAAIAVIAITIVAIAGLMWVLSSGNSGKIGKAQGLIKDALLGLALALLAFLIMALINRDLVICKKINLQAVQRANLPNNAFEVDPICRFEQASVNAARACSIGFAVESDQSKCRFADGTPNGEYNSNNRDGFVNTCCCPDLSAMDQDDFCQTLDDGASCRANGRWGYCENKRCRACKTTLHQEITAENVMSITEQYRCYHNNKNWECADQRGVCGHLASGDNDCNMESLINKSNPIADNGHLGGSAFIQPSIALTVLTANLLSNVYADLKGCWVWQNGDTIMPVCVCR